MKRQIVISIAALFIVALGAIVYRLGTMSSSQCDKVLTAQPTASELQNHKYFSSDYFEARQKFLSAAKTKGGAIESIPSPQTGPEGKPIFMDIALIGAKDSKKFIVVSSGIHGVEGFAGSAIQIGILTENFGLQLPAETSLLMIHALNPYGMAHQRRFNEDNIDLNRNFADKSMPMPDNLAYEKLSDAIAPASLSFWSEVKSWAQLLWFWITEGKAAAQAALSGGQYSHPKGLFFGGTFDAWSNLELRSVFLRYLSHAEQVIVVDVHTGLGEFGRAEIILNSPEDSPEYLRALSIWGAEIVKTTVTGKSVSVHLAASVKLAILDMLQNSEVTSVSLEFGTFLPMGVFTAVRAENWLHHYGGKSNPKASEIRECMLRTFYPDSLMWKESVWNKGKRVVEQALESLN